MFCVPGRVVGLQHQVPLNQSAHGRPGRVLTAHVRLDEKQGGEEKLL